MSFVNPRERGFPISLPLKEVGRIEDEKLHWDSELDWTGLDRTGLAGLVFCHCSSRVCNMASLAQSVNYLQVCTQHGETGRQTHVIASGC